MESPGNFDRAIVFRASPVKNFLFLLAFAAILALLIYEVLFFDNIGLIGKTVLLLGVLALVWVVGLIVRNILWWRDVVVAIGERGIYDKRLSHDWIAWATINAVEVYRVSAKGFSWRCGMSLDLDASVRQTIRETMNARLTRAMNESFGYPGTVITTSITNGSFAALKAALQEYCPQSQKVLSQELRT